MFDYALSSITFTLTSKKQKYIFKKTKIGKNRVKLWEYIYFKIKQQPSLLFYRNIKQPFFEIPTKHNVVVTTP